MPDQREPERIGRYQILGRVGKGGMGVLYRAFDPVLDREVAIKLTIADFTRDHEQIRPRFYSEARAAAKLNHRNIVTIFEFAEESNVPYIVMEFLRGMPLRARMSSKPPLSLDDKLHIVCQLCDGLAYAHAQGVVHRDVKPDNVFVMEDGSVKLLDFGIAKLKTSNLTVAGDMLGSASYMSPEQVSESESVDGRADVFSTGVVLYELLTGHKPFAAETSTAAIVKILHNPPTPMETYVKGLPPALCAAVEKALEKSPTNRFATADLLGKELQNVRRMLAAQAEAGSQDETAFADTILLKRLNDERQRLIDGQREAARQRTGTGAAEPPAGTATPTPLASAPQESAPVVTSPATSTMPPWLVPALAAGVLVIIATAFLTLSARQSPQVPASTGATTPSTTVAVPGGGSSAAASGGQAASQPATPSAPTAPAPPATPTPQPKPMTEAPVPLVVATLTGDYPFEVRDGRRVISPANTRHTLRVAAGKSLTVVAPKYYLQQTVRVEGSSREGFAWAAPGIGRLNVRSSQENCDVVIGDQVAGNPPIAEMEIAAGPHRIDISCGGEVFRSTTVTVTTGATTLAAIK